MQTDTIRVRYVGLDMQKKINTKLQRITNVLQKLQKYNNFWSLLKLQ